MNACDYCDSPVDVVTYTCTKCGYDYSALVAAGEYCFSDPE